VLAIRINSEQDFSAHVSRFESRVLVKSFQTLEGPDVKPRVDEFTDLSLDLPLLSLDDLSDLEGIVLKLVFALVYENRVLIKLKLVFSHLDLELVCGQSELLLLVLFRIREIARSRFR